uniref:Uncharacterized protein n=1 Tax=Rhizophora mucronata TaxID=61149 RepID=A0A2P2P2H4_RHIMU
MLKIIILNHQLEFTHITLSLTYCQCSTKARNQEQLLTDTSRKQ